MRLKQTWARWSPALLLLTVACGAEQDKAAVTDPVDTTLAADDAGAADGAGGITDVTEDGASATKDAGPETTALVDAGTPDAGPPDAGPPDAGDPDGGEPDVAEPDVPPVKVCNKAETKCSGAQLATCGVYEDGWIVSNCYPGYTCSDKNGTGVCVPVSNNLIIAFDTSGSMSTTVPGCSKGLPGWPTCDPLKGCSRMDVSKVTFSKALAKIDDKVTRMALLRFPQKLNFKITSPKCTTGYYVGQSTLSGEASPGPKDAQSVDAGSKWFWESLNETLCVPFPKDGMAKTKQDILKWMDGMEAGSVVGTCSMAGSQCKPLAGCAGSCCPAATGANAQCWNHTNPELRATGGTPIGKTLFYLGEYLRNQVVIDGMSCKTTAECANVNYECRQDGMVCADAATGCTKGKCIDPARSCRDTIVVLFTDGGQGNSNNFFAPWMQAKRLGFGLGCQTDADCVGGAVCKELKGAVPGQKHCRRPVTPSDWYCSSTMAPCIPSKPGEASDCDKECIRDPMSYTYQNAYNDKVVCSSASECASGETCAVPKGSGLTDKHCTSPQYWAAPLTADAIQPQDNVLRSPDGKPFGVRLYVVDISGAKSLANSMSLALAGNGKLLGTDAADPDNFLSTLNKIFDIKNLKICGTTN